MLSETSKWIARPQRLREDAGIAVTGGRKRPCLRFACALLGILEFWSKGSLEVGVKEETTSKAKGWRLAELLSPRSPADRGNATVAVECFNAKREKNLTGGRITC